MFHGVKDILSGNGLAMRGVDVEDVIQLIDAVAPGLVTMGGEHGDGEHTEVSLLRGLWCCICISPVWVQSGWGFAFFQHLKDRPY